MKTRTRGYIKELKEISLEERICIMFLCFSLMLGWSILVAQSLISSPNYPITFESYHHKTTQAKVFELLNEQLTVREADKMMAIAWCESTMNQYALHSNKDGSTDRGVFQISNKFHKEVSDECAFNTHCATNAAIKIARQRGYKEWKCAQIYNIK